MAKQNALGKKLVLYTLVVVALILLLVVVTQMGKGDGHVTFDEPVNPEGQPVLGDPQAPITIVEFGDYLCPSCKTWHQTVFPLLKEQYIDPGHARYVFINTLFHGEASLLASLAAEAVLAQNEEAFWTYHDALFQRQPEGEHNTSWLTEELLIELAESNQPAIDVQQLQSDLEARTYMDKIVLDNSLVENYQIKFTPSIMINETLLEDPFDLEAITSILDREKGEQIDE